MFIDSSLTQRLAPFYEHLTPNRGETSAVVVENAEDNGEFDPTTR